MRAPLSQNHMRLRNMYLIEMMHIVEEGHSKAWENICLRYLEDNNDINGKEDIAFSYNGETYPESVTRLTRRHILNRKSSVLDAELVPSFEVTKERYVTLWGNYVRSFKNMVSALFREASSEADLRKVIPDYIIDGIQEVDFIPLKSAKGITDERALEIKEKYKEAFEVEGFISIGNLV